MFWLGAAVSLCYIPGLTGAYIATQWPLLAVALSFDLLWCYAATQWPQLRTLLPFYPVRTSPFTAAHGAGALFIAYAVAHFYYPVPTHDGLFGLWLVIVMGLMVWLGSTLTDTRKLYAGLAIGGAVSSAVAIMQVLGINVVHTASTETARVAGIYVNAVQQGTVLALLIVGLLAERMWLWVLPLVPGLVLANTRGAWLMLAIGILGLYVRRLWLFAILGAAGVFYLAVKPPSGSDYERWQIWSVAWTNLTWFGWGPGSFYTLLLSDDNKSWFPEYAHNDALQLMFEYGVGAVFPFVVFGFALCRTEATEWPVVLAFVVAGSYSMPLFMPLGAFIALVAVGRILREHGLVLKNRHNRRPEIMERQRSAEKSGGGAVPMEPAYPATST